MRTSLNPRSARGSAALAAGIIAIPIAALPAYGGATAASAAVTAVSAKRPPATRAPATTTPAIKAPRLTTVPGLSISISDGRTAVQVGDRLSYTVKLRNSGLKRERLKITQTVPAGLRFISASRHSSVAAHQVTWPVSMAGGSADTFSVVALVTPTPPRVLQLAAVACAAAQGSSRPIICAAHLDKLPADAAAAALARQARPSAGRLLAYAAAVIAVLAAGAFVLMAGRRRRLRRSR